MSYQVFARKYRPRTFADVLGQDHVVRTLRNAIEQNRLAHAYLFVGPRGTGKTSTARIFAKALNCPNGPRIDFDPDDPACEAIARGESLDVLEIDGASHNGVDQVRDLRDSARLFASSGKFKIFYIDEVHMLSAAAFNALLKILEEPPPHVKFIFATTEAHKILPTIISRCQRFDLRRIPAGVIADHLLHIAKEEGVTLDSKAAYAIAKGADGGMRDAQSMLDQLVAFCGSHIAEQHVLDIFGFTPAEDVAQLTQAILEKNTVAALHLVATHAEAGKDLGRFLQDLIEHLRGVLVIQADPQAVDEDLPPEIATQAAAQAKAASTEQLLRIVDGLAETDARMRWASNKRLHLELAVIAAVESLHEVSINDVLTALDKAGASAADAVQVVTSRRAAAPTEVVQRVVTQPVLEISPPVAPPPAPPPPSPPAAAVVPVPQQKAAPAGELALDVAPTQPGLPERELWESILPTFEVQRRLQASFARDGVQIGCERDVVRVAFHPLAAASRESLMRPELKAILETLLSKAAGRSMKLECLLSEAAPAPVVKAKAPTAPVPAVPELALDAEPAPVAKAPEPEPQAEVAQPEEGPDPFYDDPLIKLALQRFKARVVPQN